MVGARGATTPVVAYLISGKNIATVVVAMFAIGVLPRVVAVRIAHRCGDNPPQWRKI